MNPIETQKEREEREQKRKKWISFGLLAILVFSSFGYALVTFLGNEPDNSGNAEDNGNGQIKIGEQKYNLVHTKENVKSVPIEINLSIIDYNGKIVYIDSNNSAASYEITSTLGKYSLKMQEACYGKCERNLPEKNCSSLLISINGSASNENKVRQEENCVFIEGDLRAVDAFIYRIFDGI